MARPDLSAIACTLFISSCMPQKNLHPDIHGHRGCRGLLPENSIPAFLRATELGCDYLEMDVVISRDGHVVVSHEPWMDHRICLTPDGDPIPASQERDHNLYHMTALEIRGYDCGSIAQPEFPDQVLRDTHKPLLSDVLEAVDEHALLSGMAPPSFNIEIKSDPKLYGTFQPEPVSFARKVLQAIDSIGLADRCLLQSFDTAILETIHADRPEIPLAYLVEDGSDLEHHLSRLTFLPSIYSPHYSSVDHALLAALRSKGMELVVWTVNEPADIAHMLELGVDGIISDYPDRVILALEGQ